MKPPLVVVVGSSATANKAVALIITDALKAAGCVPSIINPDDHRTPVNVAKNLSTLKPQLSGECVDIILAKIN